MCFSNDLNLSDFTVHVWNSPSLRNREQHIWKCRKASWFQKWMLKPYINTIKANKTIKHRTWNNKLFNSDDILDLLSTGWPLRSEKIIDRNSEKIMIRISADLLPARKNLSDRSLFRDSGSNPPEIGRCIENLKQNLKNIRNNFSMKDIQVQSGEQWR